MVIFVPGEAPGPDGTGGFGNGGAGGLDVPGSGGAGAGRAAEGRGPESAPSKAPLGEGGVGGATLRNGGGAGGGVEGLPDGGGGGGGAPGRLMGGGRFGALMPRRVFWRAPGGVDRPRPAAGALESGFFARPSNTSRSEPPFSLIPSVSSDRHSDTTFRHGLWGRAPTHLARRLPRARDRLTLPHRF